MVTAQEAGNERQAVVFVSRTRPEALFRLCSG